jgi:hypothetical protein
VNEAELPAECRTAGTKRRKLLCVDVPPTRAIEDWQPGGHWGVLHTADVNSIVSGIRLQVEVGKAQNNESRPRFDSRAVRIASYAGGRG